MWLLSTQGFVSIVEFSPKLKNGKAQLKGKQSTLLALPSDEFWLPDASHYGSHLMVRARVKEDLEPLMGEDPDSIYEYKPGADYHHRLIIKRSVVADHIYEQVNTIDYDSHVKETIASRAPKIRVDRYKALSSMWRALSEWQDIPPYGGKYSSSVNYNYFPSASTAVEASGNPRVTKEAFWNKDEKIWEIDLTYWDEVTGEYLYTETSPATEEEARAAEEEGSAQLSASNDYPDYSDTIPGDEPTSDAILEILKNRVYDSPIYGDSYYDVDWEELIVDYLFKYGHAYPHTLGDEFDLLGHLFDSNPKIVRTV